MDIWKSAHSRLNQTRTARSTQASARNVPSCLPRTHLNRWPRNSSAIYAATGHLCIIHASQPTFSDRSCTEFLQECAGVLLQTFKQIMPLAWLLGPGQGIGSIACPGSRPPAALRSGAEGTAAKMHRNCGTEARTLPQTSEQRSCIESLAATM